MAHNHTYTEPDLIKTEVRDHLLLIVFNRPKMRNAFNVEMLFQLSDAYTQLENDPELRCGVVYAEGKHFTLGLELDNVSEFLRKNKRFPLPENNVNPWGVVEGRPRTKPVVVAAHGMCLTLGIELMLAADIRLAAARTMFGQVEVTRGIMPFGGGTMRWVRDVGWGNAQRYLLTGGDFDAQEAYRIGLVQEVVEKKDLVDRAVAIAQSVAEQAPLAVQASLASSRKYVLEGEEAAAADLLSTVLGLMDTEDAKEGLDSFIEKRKAVYKGK